MTQILLLDEIADTQPILEKLQDLGLADAISLIQNEPRAAYVPHFFPQLREIDFPTQPPNAA
jgi:hypothetical protein